MAFDPVAGGNVPTLDGAAILARTPGLDAIADVVADRPRPDAGEPPHVRRPARDRRRSTRRRDDADASMASSSCRGPTRSRRRRSPGTSCSTHAEAGRRDRRDARVARGGLRRPGQPLDAVARRRLAGGRRAGRRRHARRHDRGGRRRHEDAHDRVRRRSRARTTGRSGGSEAGAVHREPARAGRAVTSPLDAAASGLPHHGAASASMAR